VPSENAQVKELRDWKVDRGDIRADPGIAQEILEFIEQRRVLSVAMTDSLIGCPHQQGIEYEGEWCPACEFLARTKSLYRADAAKGQMPDVIPCEAVVTRNATITS
jgi:hypothetical protein